MKELKSAVRLMVEGLIMFGVPTVLFFGGAVSAAWLSEHIWGPLGWLLVAAMPVLIITWIFKCVEWTDAWERYNER